MRDLEAELRRLAAENRSGAERRENVTVRFGQMRVAEAYTHAADLVRDHFATLDAATIPPAAQDVAERVMMEGRDD